MYIYIYIDELACSLVLLLYASMIWMVHKSSACQYIHTFSTCTLHMQCNSSRTDCNKDSLVATDFDHKSWHMARATPTYPFSKHIGFSCIFHSNLLCHCTSMQIPCYHNCLAVLLWQDEQHPKRIKTVYKTGQKTAMTQHIGLGSSISQNAFVWKGVPSPSFWSILTPVLSSLIYILYEKFQVLFVL